MPSVSDEAFDDWISQLEARARELDVDMIISVDASLSVSRIMRLLALGERLDLPVKVLSDKLDVLVTRAGIPADIVHRFPLLHFPSPSEAGMFGWVRWLLSKSGALLLGITTLPLMLLSALLIKATSKGPAFFIQTRIGVNRKPFRMFKFRTMYDRSDEIQAQVEEFNESAKGLFKIKKDPRVTPVGRFLRRFSLDELPQLINVLRGEMLLVGPRPLPRRDFENYYEEWHYSRHGGMPGLTCLWQVSGRSDLDFHDMCILDIYYLRNRSWILDVEILIRTFWVVLFARGAY
jgi:lipopolysaccharide/colanic/teichoic acid biosynthesis glycosyltransferase